MSLCLTSCSESNINMTLVCDLTDIFPKQEKNPFTQVDDQQFIWYKSNNSLESTFGNVTPYFDENDFEINFKRYTSHDEDFDKYSGEKNLLKLGKLTRSITYNKSTNRLKYIGYGDGKIRIFMDYDCKRLN